LGHLAHTGEKRNAYTGLVGKPEGKSLFGRPKCVYVREYKIKR